MTNLYSPPVVIITYNRPDLLSKLIQSLRRNDVPLVYIFSDGPKTKADEESVNEVRKVIKSNMGWCECISVFREHNLGMGKSVMNGISVVLAKHESLIMFEDDLACVEGTYEYLKNAMQRYHEEPRVTSVTAWTHPLITPKSIGNSVFFDGKSECWAVGLWRRSWEGMEKPIMQMVHECEKLGINIKKYGSDMLKMAEESEVRNRWAVNFWYNQMLKGGLCVRPPKSFVEHYGWDQRATTANNSMLRWKNPSLIDAERSKISFPEIITEHGECEQLWRKAIGY